MKVSEMIDTLKTIDPEYDMCLSEQTRVVLNDTDEEMYTVTLNMPIVGLVEVKESNEIRFFTTCTPSQLLEDIQQDRTWKKLE